MNMFDNRILFFDIKFQQFVNIVLSVKQISTQFDANNNGKVCEPIE